MLAIKRIYDRILEVIAAVLMAGLTIIIVLGFVFRALGLSLVWYDEIASIGLCWLTYYGSALAALRGAHIGFPGIVNAFPPGLRVAATIFAEIVVLAFFGIVTVTGLEVLDILQGDTLVSLPSVSLVVTQSVIPITAVLIIIAELLRFPEVLAAARGAGFEDHELKEALETINEPSSASTGAAR
ncbi:TRAP transporter small permease [Ancylobacter pratisalsi]|uniref:TRAP transporter small permease protein n=1 Tax=Ancylobacter pratisalsi TaxID=1745854 RepID=A0A6P1YKS9_9HYPH|nr:TRAP transporter small permease subunit [Ancylobacter pratisalsi]QIB32833.1 TRAP transporter small permease subunit [Ancylobacter pratisalsi]